MKSVVVAAAVCLSFFSGCRNAADNPPPPVPAAVMHSPHAPAPGPYYDGLIEEYRAILAEDPNNLAAITALGNAYFDSGRWHDAIILYERALAINPRNADVHTDMGTAYRNLGRPDRALAEYRRALELDPGHVNAHYNMGIVYAYDVRNYPVAVHVWEELLRIAPNHPHADYVRTCVATFKKQIAKGDK